MVGRSVLLGSARITGIGSGGQLREGFLQFVVRRRNRRLSLHGLLRLLKRLLSVGHLLGSGLLERGPELLQLLARDLVLHSLLMPSGAGDVVRRLRRFLPDGLLLLSRLREHRIYRRRGGLALR